MFEVYKILNSDKKTEVNGRKIFLTSVAIPITWNFGRKGTLFLIWTSLINQSWIKFINSHAISAWKYQISIVQCEIGLGQWGISYML